MENLSPEGDVVAVETPEVPEIKQEATCVSVEEDCDKANSGVTVQSYINELKIKRTLLNNEKSPERSDKDADRKEEEPKIKNETTTTVLEVRLRRGDCLDVKSRLQVPKTVPVSPESTKKKVRKRRPINRTGFPTVKKKKKKIVLNEATTNVSVDEGLNSLICDRVPKEGVCVTYYVKLFLFRRILNYLGEEVKEFLERSSTNNSMQDLTTINSENLPPSDDAISECESLPLHERIDFEPDGCSRYVRFRNG